MKVYTSLNEKSLATLVGVVMTDENDNIIFKDFSMNGWSFLGKRTTK